MCQSVHTHSVYTHGLEHEPGVLLGVMSTPTPGLFGGVRDIHSLLHRLMFASPTDSWINSTTLLTFTTVCRSAHILYCPAVILHNVSPVFFSMCTLMHCHTNVFIIHCCHHFVLHLTQSACGYIIISHLFTGVDKLTQLATPNVITVFYGLACHQVSPCSLTSHELDYCVWCNDIMFCRCTIPLSQVGLLAGTLTTTSSIPQMRGTSP